MDGDETLKALLFPDQLLVAIVVRGSIISFSSVSFGQMPRLSDADNEQNKIEKYVVVRKPRRKEVCIVC